MIELPVGRVAGGEVSKVGHLLMVEWQALQIGQRLICGAQKAGRVIRP